MSIFDKVNPGKIVSKIEHEVSGLASRVLGEIKSAGSQALGEIKSAGSQALGEVEGAGHKALGEIEGAGHKALGELESAAGTVKGEVEHLVHEALEAALSALASGALQKAVDVIQVALPSSATLSLGPISLTMDDLTDRVDHLQELAKHPPAGMDGLKSLIKQLAPTSVGLTLSVELAMLVVSSDSLSLGADLSWETEDFLAKIDDIVAKL